MSFNYWIIHFNFKLKDLDASKGVGLEKFVPVWVEGLKVREWIIATRRANPEKRYGYFRNIYNISQYYPFQTHE